MPPGDTLSLFSNVRHCSWVVRKLRPCFKVSLKSIKLAASRKQALPCSFVSEMMILYVADNTSTSTFKGLVFIALDFSIWQDDLFLERLSLNLIDLSVRHYIAFH